MTCHASAGEAGLQNEAFGSKCHTPQIAAERVAEGAFCPLCRPQVEERRAARQICKFTQQYPVSPSSGCKISKVRKRGGQLSQNRLPSMLSRDKQCDKVPHNGD